MMRWRAYPEYVDTSEEWIGRLPTHWTRKRLKYVAPESGQKHSEKPEDLPYLGLEHIESGTGKILSHDSADQVDSTVVAFKSGDILFGKLRPYLAKVVQADFDGVGTTQLLVLRPTEDVHSRYLFYELLSDGFIETIDSLTYGTRMPRANPDQVGDQAIPLAPLPEERAIAAFLDRETARIDALVAKFERLIALLEERRAALISHAVTKGVDPDVPMKDSGIPWLGEIPAHWEIMQLRRVVQRFIDFRGRTPTKTEDGITLITARNIQDGTITFENSHEYIAAEDYGDWMVRGLPESGDVVLTTEAPLGSTAQISDPNVALAQRIILFKVQPDLITNNYLRYHFLSAYGQAELWSQATGSTAEGIKASHLREIRVAVPPITEQRIIVTHLENQISRILPIVDAINRGIVHLQEYRTALISAAVTGKIDVRQEVG